MVMGTPGAHHGPIEASPLGIQSKKLAMWLFIMADAATFGAILFAYGYVRVAAPDWPHPFEMSSIVNGVIMTVVLLTSSLTMLGGVLAAQAQKTSTAMRWMWATVLLGILFAGLHLKEWFGMIGAGWSPSHNPLGGPVNFGAAFFGITGMHLLHVISGAIAIGVVALMFGRGRLNAAHVETVGLYWHFVDLVWMFVFPLVYLLNAR